MMSEDHTEVSHKYGLRDDISMVLTLFPPNSSYTVEVRGHIRNVIDLVNIVGWKMSGGKVDVDEFLEWQNRDTHSNIGEETQTLQGSVKK